MRSTFTVAAMALFLSVTAQPRTDKATINWGPELQEKATGTFGYVIGQSDDAVYMTFWKKDKLFVQKMTGGLTSAYHKAVDLTLDKKDLTVSTIMLAGDGIIIFATRFDKKADLKSMYMRLYDASNMEPRGAWERLAEFSSTKAYAGGFQMDVSPNEEHILIGINLPYEKEASERFRVRVYDKQMSLEWEREITMPYTDKEFGVRGMLLENDGDVVAVGVKYLEKQEAREKKREGKATYDYHLLTFNSEGEYTDNTITSGERFLQDLTISLDDGDGPILCGGFYGIKGANKVRGAFFMSLDPDSKAILHESYKEFSDDFITQYMTPKEEEKAKKKAEKKEEELQLFEYDLDEIIRREDGGAVLVGEQYFMYTRTVCTTTQNGGQTCRTIYHYVYNDIIVVNISPEGDIEWASTVPKRQHTANDGGYFSSYALEVRDENLYFIFNDNGENLFKAAGDKFKQMDLQGKGSIVTLATVDQDGRVTREALFDPEKRELILRPKSCRQLEDDRMFLYATRKKDYRFGMATFQD